MGDRSFGFGWVPDTPSIKDHKLTVPAIIGLPTQVDLGRTPFQPPILNQGATSSCVGHACSSLVHFLRRKLGLPEFQPSRLFAYYFARFVRHSDWHTVDEGAMIRDAMTALTVVGVCSEQDWPFDVSKINVRPDPPDVVAAGGHRTLRYVRMLRGANSPDDLYYLRRSLADGYPWGFGISVYSSFFDAGGDGVVPMPKVTDSLEGGHMMYAVGYSDTQQLFKCANSWGEDWGDGGFAYLPYDYFRNEDLSDDMWTLRTMKETTV